MGNISNLKLLQQYIEDAKWNIGMVSYYIEQRFENRPTDLDFDEVIDELKHLNGFISCMIDFGIELTPEKSIS